MYCRELASLSSLTSLFMMLSTIRGVVAGDSIPKVSGNNVGTCKSSALDWYRMIVGETPCATYGKLRQIDDLNFTVPNFLSTPPGDACRPNRNSFHSCTNSIAYSLSMLCMNCQQCEDASTGCVDAASGTYKTYVNGLMHSPLNGSLDTSIKTHVCNRNIQLPNFLFQSVPPDGSWSFNRTMSSAKATGGNPSKLVAFCNVLNASKSFSAALTLATSKNSTNADNQGTTSNSPLSTEIILALVTCSVAVAIILAAVVITIRKRRHATKLPV